MRCVLVNAAKLKAPTLCAHCGHEISESYVREVGSRLIYCDFRCYSVAVQTASKALGYHAPALSAWTRGS
jgi:hypothetical protein